MITSIYGVGLSEIERFSFNTPPHYLIDGIAVQAPMNPYELSTYENDNVLYGTHIIHTQNYVQPRPKSLGTE